MKPTCSLGVGDNLPCKFDGKNGSKDLPRKSSKGKKKSSREVEEEYAKRLDETEAFDPKAVETVSDDTVLR